MKQCIKCQADIPDNSKYCDYCGARQGQELKQESPKTKSEKLKTTEKITIRQCPMCKNDIPITRTYCDYCGTKQEKLLPGEEVKEEVMEEIPITKSPPDKEIRKKQWKIAGIIVGLILAFGITLGGVGTLLSSHPSRSDYAPIDPYEEEETEEDSAPADSYEEEETEDSALYSYYDKTMSEAIQSYNTLIGESADNEIAAIAMKMPENRFRKMYSNINIFSDDGEVCDIYFGLYFNKESQISFSVNENNQVIGIHYGMPKSSYNEIIQYKKTAIEEQLLNNPARWIYAFSDTLTFEDAFDIYLNLYEQLIDNDTLVASDSGYVLAVRGGDENVVTWDIFKGGSELENTLLDSIDMNKQLFYGVDNSSDNMN